MNEFINKLAETAIANGDSISIVGGAVRDAQFGLEPKDYDLTITSREAIGRLLNTIPGNVVHEFMATDHEVVMVAFEGQPLFEFSVIADLTQSAKARDFTVNAMFMVASMVANEVTWNLFDPINGSKDVENRILRPVSATIFIDDHRRVLRAGYQASALGMDTSLLTELAKEADFNFDSKTLWNQGFSKWTRRSSVPSKALRFFNSIGLGTAWSSFNIASEAILRAVDEAAEGLTGDDLFFALWKAIADEVGIEATMEFAINVGAPKVKVEKWLTQGRKLWVRK